ncbi:MAG TPA: long-chain fatty acid--CoA ligase [Vicinamibacteria bacterium]
MFLWRVAATPDAEAFSFPQGDGWERLSWRQAGDRVRAIACGLASLGLEREQRCAIVSSTRIEWILVDFGILTAGGATTTIYPSSTAEECAYILRDSAATVAFVENEAQLAKLRGQRDALPDLRTVVLMEGAAPPEAGTLTLAELEARGAERQAAAPGSYEEGARALRPDSLATLVYTSGTTGRPKGVELIHDCWVYEAEAIDALRLLAPEDRQYLWLPLSHIFGKVLEAAQVRIGFPTAVDGRVDRMVDNLQVVRPTFVAAVPRVFEKVRSRVVTTAQEGGSARFAVFKWAFGVGRAASARRARGQGVGPWLAARRWIADRLVFRKLRARFGGRLRFFISGSAPLSREVAEFFHAAGVLILEGYGLTESSAATCVNRPDRYRFGTVGPALPGTELRVAPADGEVLIRGRGVMRGYHGLPEATAEALDAEGWLRTGDIGTVDDEGFLTITDRKKDLIKTSGGKYIAPQAIEGRFKAACPYVAQVLVHGDRRKFCSALVTLEPEAIRAWAAGHGLGSLSLAELAAHPLVNALIQGHVDELNAKLASFETVKKFAVLPVEFTPESGDLTASLKLKRKHVEGKYAAQLDAFYAEAGASV